MKIKRLLSALLALSMLAGICLMGIPVSAEEELPFTDVTKNWAYDAIKYVYENGLMNGTGGTNFSPKGNLTRAMVVTVLYRLEGSPRVTYNDIYLDVVDRKYYSDAVVWAKSARIVTATSVTEWGEEYFSPERDITRQELATMFIRYAEYRYVKTQSTASLDKFTDSSKVAGWAQDAMKWATEVGLINGTGNGSTLSPKMTATRAEFATIIHRFNTIEFKYEHNYSEPKPLSTYTEPDYPLVNDADVYVAVDGDDNNPGTLDKPLATFEAAKAKVRELKKTAKDEIKVAFKAGNYGVLDNVTFTADDSGTEEVPITYCKYGDGNVIFSNGIIIPQSDFVLVDDSYKDLFKKEALPYIYKVDLKGKIDRFDFNTRLFTETGLATEAREPNKNYYSNVTTTVDDHASIRLQDYLPGIVEKFSSYEGVKVTGFLRTGWLVDTFPVLSYDPDEDLLTFDFENAPFDNGYSLDTYPLMYEGRTDDLIYFSNLPEFLDNTGEYWFDNENSALYVYRAKGNYAIDNGGTFITVKKDAEHLSFVGLEFNTTSSTAIKVSADHFTLDMCKIGNVGGRAAVDASDVTDFTVKNSEFSNCVDTCVALDSGLEDQKNLIPGNNVIENNYFHDFTLPQYFSSAVEVSHDVGTYIAHNYFYEGGHGAVRYNDCIDLIIEYNIFNRIMTKTQDFGAIYTWNSVTYRDNIIRYNLLMDVSVIAIYLDDNTCGQQVYGNIFYDTASIVQNGGRENEIHDNIFIKGGGVTSNPGRYSYIADGNPEGFTTGDEFYNRFMNDKPKEGDPMYDEWYKRWPELYNYNIDPSKVGDPECLFTTFTYLSDNVAFGEKVHDSEMIKMFGIDTNNKNLSLDENPYFVNPSIGNYTIKEGADFFDIQFEKIGRY